MGEWFFTLLAHCIVRHQHGKVSPMTTAVRNPVAFSDEAVNMKFLEMMPVITKSARIAFAGYNQDRRAEAVQNILCCAFLNLKNLAASGKTSRCSLTPDCKVRHWSAS
jgi:hypothetical protein